MRTVPILILEYFENVRIFTANYTVVFRNYTVDTQQLNLWY